MMRTLLAATLLTFSSPVLAQEIIPTTYSLPPGETTSEQRAVEYVPPVSREQLRREREERNLRIVRPFEVLSIATHVGDFVTTWECTKMWRRGWDCYEKNTKVYGSRHPGLKKILLVKGLTIVGSVAAGREISKRSPEAGIVWHSVQIVYTGKLVGTNIRILTR